MNRIVEYLLVQVDTNMLKDAGIVVVRFIAVFGGSDE